MSITMTGWIIDRCGLSCLFLETHLECFRIGRSVRCGLQGLVESLIQILELVFYELPGHLLRSFSSFVKEDWLLATRSSSLKKFKEEWGLVDYDLLKFCKEGVVDVDSSSAGATCGSWNDFSLLKACKEGVADVDSSSAGAACGSWNDFSLLKFCKEGVADVDS